MSSAPYDLCTIGNALVDLLFTADDGFLNAQAIAKGGMALITQAQAETLYDKAGAAIETSSGGSAANTLAGFASLGGKGAYLGKVGRDEFGKIFTHDMQAQNIHFATKPSDDLPSGRCLVFVTPDAQRSMATFLGAATEFGPDDVDAAIVGQAQITYLEGYLFDRPQAQAAFYMAADVAHQAGRKMALTLSDSFCVSRHRDAFLKLVSEGTDILFANEHEIKSLYATDDLQQALNGARAHTEIAVVTRGAQGALIASSDKTYEVAAHPVASVIDTTGAGDLYAAGFLYGLTRQMPLTECGRIGAIAAAEVISHYGPRPQKKLSTLI